MALVELLQATDMGTLTALSGGASVNYDTTYFSIYNPTSYASVAGIDLTYNVFDDIEFGTVVTLVMDTSDPDLIPNVVVKNLSFQPHGNTDFGNDLHINFVAALQIVMSGSDTVIGSPGNDTIFGFAGNDILKGGGGSLDRFEGGAGADKLIGGPGLDQAQYSFAPAGVVADLLHPSLNKGEAAGDTYFAINSLRGSNSSDSLFGNDGPNSLGGGNGGDDRLFGRGGRDDLNGGPDNDLLDGGLGYDTLSGGTGRDRFDFNSIADSKPGAVRDVIEDFSELEQDVIDLSTIDADQRPGHPGNQAFRYIGSDTFAHFHALHPAVFAMVRFAGGIVQGNVNGTLGADFEIAVPGPSVLAAVDFVL
jgi:serralysin